MITYCPQLYANNVKATYLVMKAHLEDTRILGKQFYGKDTLSYLEVNLSSCTQIDTIRF